MKNEWKMVSLVTKDVFLDGWTIDLTGFGLGDDDDWLLLMMMMEKC